MSRRLDYQMALPIQERLPDRGVVREINTGAPPTTAGVYSPGALYQRLDGAAATTFYLMTGTKASPSWQAIGSGVTLAALTVTALTTSGIVRTAQTYKVGGRAKVGGTSGWVVAAANDLGTIATVPQSQSASTLVIPIGGLHVGDTITGFGVYSSINSGGNTVTLDANLRKLVIAAGASATDSSIGSITQVSVTAATASAATKTGLTEVVAAGTQYYLLLTVTTGATTTVELAGAEVTVTTA